MANVRDVARLQEGARAWNAWRAQNPDIVPDLSGLNLPVGLREFEPAPGGPIDLRRADLRAAVLEQATLIGAKLEGASLARANLSHARLDNADLSGADLREANLEHADLRDAELDGANLSGARLGRASNVTQAQINRAVGDETTVLPVDLVRPDEWLGEPPVRRVVKVAKRSTGTAHATTDDPYTILGVGRRASGGEIRAAYLRLVKELHPDGRAPDAGADEELKRINDAYQKLKGFGGRAGARRAEPRRFARRASALFTIGVLTSGAPLIGTLGWLYFAGLLGPRAIAPNENRAALKSVAESVHSKDASAGREAAWAQALEQGTREAWERFVAAYPDGEHASKAKEAIAAIDREAKRRQEQAAWAAAERSGGKEQLVRFVEAYPDGEHASKAKVAIAEIAAAEARLEADRAAWAEAGRSGGKAALRQYLLDFPKGSFVAQAKGRVTEIEAHENEKDDAAWLKAERRHSKAAYATYLTDHPNGRRARDARLRIGELESAEARPTAEPVKTSAPAAGKSRVPEAAGGQRWPVADEPFIGADGRIRR